VTITPQKLFYGALQKVEFTYQTGGSTSVVVNLVRLADGAVIQTWQQPPAPPGASTKVVWGGTASGRVQPEGYYSFRVAPAASDAGVGGAAVGEGSFAFYAHMFPIRGPHQYSLSAGRFGAPRSGHIHQGQDVMAACGTPLVAARAGKVVYAGYHSLAGYYVVIHGQGSGLDYAYMHLSERALVNTGDRVYTGQPLGEVGQTGDATACHLHLELWSAPGWYKGGHPIDPLADLRHWDQAS
jgi:murein DD-endopeptidase MepM/ murein hydrolase activator NlpD